MLERRSRATRRHGARGVSSPAALAIARGSQPLEDAERIRVASATSPRGQCGRTPTAGCPKRASDGGAWADRAAAKWTGTGWKPVLRERMQRGAARALEPGYGSKRSQDGEAQRTCSESRPGGPRRTSGDRAWAAPSERPGRAQQAERTGTGYQPVLRKGGGKAHRLETCATGNEAARGCPCPIAGLWEQAKPGWRSAADMQ